MLNPANPRPETPPGWPCPCPEPLFSPIVDESRDAVTMPTIRFVDEPISAGKVTCPSEVMAEAAKKSRRNLHPVEHAPGARPRNSVNSEGRRAARPARPWERSKHNWRLVSVHKRDFSAMV